MEIEVGKWATDIKLQEQLELLSTQGYCIIKQACSFPSGSKASILQDLEDIFGGKEYPLYSSSFNSKGIISCPSEIAHLSSVKQVRFGEERVLYTYQQIYKTRSLIGSCDRIQFQPPWVKKPHTRLAYKDWWHCDQDPIHCQGLSVQGYINLGGGQEEKGTAGCLQVLKGSHLFTQEYLEKKNLPWTKANWYNFCKTVTDLTFIELFEKVSVESELGDLVLWDSRIIHQSRKHKDPTSPRLAIYVCFTPAATTPNYYSKKKIFEAQRVTTHTPGARYLFPKQIRTYGYTIPTFDHFDFKEASVYPGQYQDRVTLHPAPIYFN